MLLHWFKENSKRPTPSLGVVLIGVVLLGGFGLIGSPQDALACAVCGVGKEESRIAFIFTTVLLSAVPLIMLGFGGYLAHRRYSGKPLPFEKKSGDSGDPVKPAPEAADAPL